MEKLYTIEFYMEGDMFCCYIGEENTSGYKIQKLTKEELLNDLKDYLNTDLQ